MHQFAVATAEVVVRGSRAEMGVIGGVSDGKGWSVP